MLLEIAIPTLELNARETDSELLCVRQGPTCLVPGAGLGRLACEISRLGMYFLAALHCFFRFKLPAESHVKHHMFRYFFISCKMFLYMCGFNDAGFIAQGNEFSYYMLMCSSFILNQ